MRRPVNMTTADVPRLLNDLFQEVEQKYRQREARDAETDPQKHKRTRVMAPGVNTNWRYGGYIKSRGKKISYCWSCHRNAAGYFLGWRQVESKDGSIKRDQFTARKVKKRLEELQMRRTQAHSALLMKGSK